MPATTVTVDTVCNNPMPLLCLQAQAAPAEAAFSGPLPWNAAASSFPGKRQDVPQAQLTAAWTVSMLCSVAHKSSPAMKIKQFT